MRWVLGVLLVAAACAPKPYAKFRNSPRHILNGEKWVTVVGSGDVVTLLEAYLQDRGFRVSRSIPGVRTELPTRYVINVGGDCWRPYIGLTMRVETFDTRFNELVSTAWVMRDDDCPSSFFREVAAELDRLWAPAELPKALPADF